MQVVNLLQTLMHIIWIYFQRFADVLNQYEVASALFCQADQERSNLILHETSAKSVVAEATSNSEKIRASFEVQAREFAQAKAVVTEKAQEATTWIEQHGRILDALQSNLIPEINAWSKLSGSLDALSLTSAVLVAGVPFTIVPEPTQVQCHDIDKEVSQHITEVDTGLSSAVIALQAYSLALRRILPLNYLTTSSMHSWAQILQLSVHAPSGHTLSLSRRQAAELIMKGHGDNIDSITASHEDLCVKVEKYAVEIQRVEEECAELVNSIGSETESKAKDRFLSTFVKYVKSAGLIRKEEVHSSNHSGLKSDGAKDSGLVREQEENKEKVLSVLNIALGYLYEDVKCRVLEILNDSADGNKRSDSLQSTFGNFFCKFEEQVEKCLLVAEFANELRQLLGSEISNADADTGWSKHHIKRNWVSIFKTSLLSCKSLVDQMTEVVLPDVLRSAISFNSEVMDAFGLISQIRGSVDTALEQLVEVELERASLVELERNYFAKVGLISEQQLALEEAALKSRDHLSWEEAEELASQEEACRAELNQLHQTWNQRDMRTSSLMKREGDIRHALISSERHFLAAINSEESGEPHVSRSKVLLAILAKPFSELESIDRTLASFGGSLVSNMDGISKVTDWMSSGHSISELIWNLGSLLNGRSFFIWKISVVDSFLDSCVQDIASSMDQNLGFDQLLNIVKRKLEFQLQNQVGQYLREQVAPSFIASLEKRVEQLKKSEASKELTADEVKKGSGAVRKVHLMLEQYCNAHETVRAAKSAVSIMKKRATELREALQKTTLEIVQMEWMHDATVNPSYNSRIPFKKFFPDCDNIYQIILNISRPKLMETLQSAVSKIAMSVECLQGCEQASQTAEGQLERAMAWACGGSNSGAAGNSTRNSGIPPEFHDHLMRRRQVLWEAREKASDIVKVCMSVLEFEASRDGIFQYPGQLYPLSAGGDGKAWQQAYLNAITKLEVAYHSFTSESAY